MTIPGFRRHSLSVLPHLHRHLVQTLVSEQNLQIHSFRQSICDGARQHFLSAHLSSNPGLPLLRLETFAWPETSNVNVHEPKTTSLRVKQHIDFERKWLKSHEQGKEGEGGGRATNREWWTGREEGTLRGTREGGEGQEKRENKNVSSHVTQRRAHKSHAKKVIKQKSDGDAGSEGGGRATELTEGTEWEKGRETVRPKRGVSTCFPKLEFLQCSDSHPLLLPTKKGQPP